MLISRIQRYFRTSKGGVGKGGTVVKKEERVRGVGLGAEL